MAFRFPLRWQFSLRTMFIVVAMLSLSFAYVAHQAEIVRHRKEMRIKINRDWLACHQYLNDCISLRSPQTISEFVREQLGDHIELTIDLAETTSDGQVAEIRQLFPESSVDRYEDKFVPAKLDSKSNVPK